MSAIHPDVWLTPDDIQWEKGWLWCLLRFGGNRAACEIANQRNRKMYEELSERRRLRGARPVPPPNIWSVD